MRTNDIPGCMPKITNILQTYGKGTVRAANSQLGPQYHKQDKNKLPGRKIRFPKSMPENSTNYSQCTKNGRLGQPVGNCPSRNNKGKRITGSMLKQSTNCLQSTQKKRLKPQVTNGQSQSTHIKPNMSTNCFPNIKRSVRQPVGRFPSQTNKCQKNIRPHVKIRVLEACPKCLQTA